MIDFHTQLLPDAITLPLLWVGLLLSATPAGFADLHGAVVGAAAGYLVLWLVYWAFKLATGKEGMGFGDFKLLAALGAWLGWQALPLIVLLSSAVGALLSQGPIALFDLPWMPIYLIFVYLLHPYLGALTLGGAFVLTMLTIVTELMTRKLGRRTPTGGITRNNIADSNTRNADILKAMGFAGRAVDRFNTANGEHLQLQTRANDITGTLGAISRVLRMLLQSALLGLGAYLTIKGELSAGGIIASSVASSRALAPIDLAIGNWKSVVAARLAFRRLRETVIAMSEIKEPMPLPAPTVSLKIEKITVAAPASGRVLLSEIEFELKAGDGLGGIGPSAGGKTTLVRALTGVWPVLRGSIRLDDAELTQWNDDVLGRHLGYLPQDVALLDASIEENISRFAENADPRALSARPRPPGSMR